MGWVILYSALAIAFAVAFFFPSGTHLTISEAAKDTAGLLGSIASLIQALARTNLNVYLLLQRIRIWFARTETSHWKFALRLDGLASDDPLKDVVGSLNTNFARWQPRVAVDRTPQRLSIVIDRTIHLNLDFVPPQDSEDAVSHLLINSDELEVGLANAETKLEDTVVPILIGFLDLLRPLQSSAMFEVSFQKTSPFFSFYVEHLKPDQVKHFNLVFLPELSHGSSADRVTVTSRTIEITTGTIDSMKRLAKALLTLSSDASTLTRG